MADRTVDQWLADGWHACLNGSGFRMWHKGRAWQPMTESQAADYDARQLPDSRPLGAKDTHD